MWVGLLICCVELCWSKRGRRPLCAREAVGGGFPLLRNAVAMGQDSFCCCCFFAWGTRKDQERRGRRKGEQIPALLRLVVEGMEERATRFFLPCLLCVPTIYM